MAHHINGLQADDRPRPLPLVNEDQLQPLKGEPQPGDVLSYRLLEIGENFSPQVCRGLLHPAQCVLCAAARSQQEESLPVAECSTIMRVAC